MYLKTKIVSLLIAFLMAITIASPVLANDDTVTVYFTLSNDGNFVIGNDDNSTVLAHVPVTISYFDLADYELEQFYRYESASFEEGGYYTGDEVLRRPTLLHLYIKMIEQYYLNSDTLSMGITPSRYAVDMAGNEITGGDVALGIVGSPTSMYMQYFWGHDENLMYYVNHQYPLMAAGWGSTADYILLEDGMEIDVAMFTDWNFFTHGAFAYFSPSAASVQTGDAVNFQTLSSATVAAQDGSSLPPVQMPGLKTTIYNSNWQAVASTENNTLIVDENGDFSYIFNTPGTYYVEGKENAAGTGTACIAPAIATVTVTEESMPRIESVMSNARLGKIAVQINRALENDEVLIVSLYRGNTLIEIHMETIATQNGKTDILVSSENIGAADTIKALWWRDLKTIQPLCEAYEEE